MAIYRPASVETEAFTLPGPYYTSDAIYRQEIERIFLRDWLYIGRASQIPQPGDYFLAEMFGESLIIVRGKDGAVRALFNVCRHRGTRLLTEGCGRLAETVQCPYHAWTYGLDGRLLAARLMGDAPGFDKSSYPLRQAAVFDWEGFLFMSLAREPKPFESELEALIDKFPTWALRHLDTVCAVEYDVQANWKLVVENYSECYHCPLVHPALTQLSPPTSGRNDLLEGPVLGGYMLLNEDVLSMTVDGGTARSPVGDVGGDDLGRVYYYSIFPNLLLSLHPDYVMSHRLTPLGPARTRVVCEWHFDPAAVARPDFDPSDAVEFWDTTNRQDWRVCELSQLGVSSRAYAPGPYAHAEGLLWAFDQEYLQRLEG